MKNLSPDDTIRSSAKLSLLHKETFIDNKIWFILEKINILVKVSGFQRTLFPRDRKEDR